MIPPKYIKAHRDYFAMRFFIILCFLSASSLPGRTAPEHPAPHGNRSPVHSTHSKSLRCSRPPAKAPADEWRPGGNPHGQCPPVRNRRSSEYCMGNTPMPYRCSCSSGRLAALSVKMRTMLFLLFSVHRPIHQCVKHFVIPRHGHMDPISGQQFPKIMLAQKTLPHRNQRNTFCQSQPGYRVRI